MAKRPAPGSPAVVGTCLTAFIAHIFLIGSLFEALLGFDSVSLANTLRTFPIRTGTLDCCCVKTLDYHPLGTGYPGSPCTLSFRDVLLLASQR